MRSRSRENVDAGSKRLSRERGVSRGTKGLLDPSLSVGLQGTHGILGLLLEDAPIGAAIGIESRNRATIRRPWKT